MNEKEYDQTFLSIQKRLVDYTKILQMEGGRTKNNDGSYSTTSGVLMNYLRVSDVVDDFGITEKQADKLLYVIKEMSPDLALPKTYKAVESRVMAALSDRYQNTYVTNIKTYMPL